MFDNKIILNNEQESKFLAKKLAQNLSSGNIIIFTGDLGCGKTFLCREIIKYFCGVNTNVISPTFNLLQTYETSNFIIYHFDLYRLTYIEEIYELGIEDSMQDNLCLIEWPEIIENILPKPVIKVELQMIEHNKRICNIKHLI